MQAEELSSSQEFIRALKAPKDPPKPGGIRKIDLAKQAWELESLFIPSKAEVIVEWLLQSLLAGGQTESILDTKPWELLESILRAHTWGTDRDSVPAWLNGVINGVPVLPIFAFLLRGLRKAPIVPLVTLGAATSAARGLLPLASLRASCDAVAGCFWEVLGVFSTQDIPEELLLSALELCKLIVLSFEASFGNHSNKKKIAGLLVDHHLSSWLSLSTWTRNSCSQHSALVTFRHELFQVGCSVVFSPDHTRAIFQYGDVHPVLSATASSPPIFTAYISALRAHKLSVFLDQNTSTGGLAKRICGAARELFVLSVADRRWSVVAQLIQSAEELQVVDDEWAGEFRALVESAVQALDNKSSDDQVHICSTLACILRLDVQAIEPFTEQLLSGFCDAPGTLLAAAGTLFDLLLEYHSKARTLHDFLPRLAGALVPRPNVAKSCDFYRAACVGPILDTAFTAKLRRAVAAFITPGQILPCTRHLLSNLTTLFTTVHRGSEPPPKKRRKLVGIQGDDDDAAVHVALSSRLVVNIISSLPVKTLRPDALEELRVAVDEFDASVLSATINTLVDTGVAHLSCARQIVLAAALRIRYALRQKHCPVRIRRIYEDRDADEELILSVIEDTDISAELVTEAVRVLTLGERSKEHVCAVWGLVLARIQREADHEGSWNGSLAHLDNHVWFPLLFLLLDRQLHLVESSLTADHLKTILDLFVNMSYHAEASGCITSARLFSKTVGLAEFWEMPNLRKALNEKIVTDTGSLDEADLHKALKTMRKGKVPKQAGSHEVAISMYHVAALAPPDYLDKPTRATLLSRAPCADVLATRPKDRAVVRAVLRQLSSVGGLPEEYIRYLLDPWSWSTMGASEPDDVLSILAASFRLYARLAKETGAPNDLIDILRSVSTLRLFELPLWEDPAAVPSIRATLSLLDTVLETWGAKSTLPEDVRMCMVEILRQIAGRADHTESVTDLLIEATRTLVACEHWLQLGGVRKSRGRLFLKALVEQNSIATEALLRLLTEEIRDTKEDVRLLLAAFTLNAHDHDKLRAAEHSFGEACRRIAAEQHEVLVDEIVTLLLQPESNCAYRIAIIRMASLVLRFAPEGTSKARRRKTTSALHALGQIPQLAMFQEASTTFIAEICSDRANALSAPDMTAIWVLLDRATNSTDETFLGCYSSIVASINCLVRFRRDLLTHTLAQLAALLTRLIRILRLRTSHAIGASQRSAESQASLAGKAAELSRLLVGLSTKTVARLSMGSKHEQSTKAESLARPFARHAPYLLVAYAGSAADMSTAVRNALKPGLFALCAMCGTPARDMLMVTMLDTVERDVFGGVWREWEAQKYTGKG